eukprot:358812-Chlamydomonas_euryale.AAC.3
MAAAPQPRSCRHALFLPLNHGAEHNQQWWQLAPPPPHTPSQPVPRPASGGPLLLPRHGGHRWERPLGAAGGGAASFASRAPLV